MSKTLNPQQELQDSIDLGAATVLGPQLPVLPPRPRLCEAGPCKNYHRLELQVDAQQPSAGAPVFHAATHHYCYPSPGVDIELGALPIVSCNRWRPLAPPSVAYGEGLTIAPAEYMATPEGQAYAEAVARWEADRPRAEAEAQAATEAANLLLDAEVEGLLDSVEIQVEPARDLTSGSRWPFTARAPRFPDRSGHADSAETAIQGLRIQLALDIRRRLAAGLPGLPMSATQGEPK